MSIARDKEESPDILKWRAIFADVELEKDYTDHAWKSSIRRYALLAIFVMIARITDPLNFTDPNPPVPSRPDP